MDIHSEASEQNAFLDSLNSGFYELQDRLGSTIHGVKNLLNMHGGGFSTIYFAMFCFLVLFILWWLM